VNEGEIAFDRASVRSSGEQAGVGFQRRDETTDLFAHEARIRESAEFVDSSAID
jgi:hypothetical protein